jgi:hypothetical protein
LKGYEKIVGVNPVAAGFPTEGDIEHLAIEMEEPAECFIDSAAKFLSVEDPPLEYFIPEITPKGVIALSHGDPRTMKSLAALEEFVALATGTPAFGMERFRPARPYRVLYCSQEDAASIVRTRVKKLLKARSITTVPDTMGFAIYKGIDFDDAEWRARFLEGVLTGAYENVDIDPARAFTAFADAGPKEVLPIAKFLRQLTVRGITVRLIHHDTKPPASGPDTRRRSHRASGGGWFSVSECPMAFEKISDRQSLVSPEDYKLSGDPRPFTITYHEDAKGLRLIGEDSTAAEAKTLAIDEKILTYLAEHVGASGTSITTGVRARKDAVLQSLARLLDCGKVDCAEHGRSKLWTLQKAAK